MEQFRILQVGDRVTVYLNDKLVVDQARLENFWNHNLPLPKQGPIQLQTHGGEIRWRNILSAKSRRPRPSKSSGSTARPDSWTSSTAGTSPAEIVHRQ